jgi:hypothetical protein
VNFYFDCLYIRPSYACAKVVFCNLRGLKNTHYGVSGLCCKFCEALQLTPRSAYSHLVLCVLKSLHAHHRTTARVRDDVLALNAFKRERTRG